MTVLLFLLLFLVLEKVVKFEVFSPVFFNSSMIIIKNSTFCYDVTQVRACDFNSGHRMQIRSTEHAWASLPWSDAIRTVYSSFMLRGSWASSLIQLLFFFFFFFFFLVFCVFLGLGSNLSFSWWSTPQLTAMPDL